MFIFSSPALPKLQQVASPDVVVIEDELNLEDLMKQKELLQARLGAFLSDSEENGDGEEGPTIATPPLPTLDSHTFNVEANKNRGRNGDRSELKTNKNDVVLLLDDSSGEQVAKRRPLASSAATSLLPSATAPGGGASTKQSGYSVGRGSAGGGAADHQRARERMRPGRRSQSPNERRTGRERSPNRSGGVSGVGSRRQERESDRSARGRNDAVNRNREDLRREIDRDRDRNQRERERERMRRHEGQGGQERSREFDGRRRSPEMFRRDERNNKGRGGDVDRERRGHQDFRSNKGGGGGADRFDSNRRDRSETDRRKRGGEGRLDGEKRDRDRKRKESSSESDLGDIDIKDDDDEDEEKIIEQRRKQREALLKVSFLFVVILTLVGGFQAFMENMESNFIPRNSASKRKPAM